MLLSVALIAAVSFREPVVVPPVREFEYRDDVEVCLNEKTEIVLRCPSLDAAAWVSRRFKDWFGEDAKVRADAAYGDGTQEPEGYCLKTSPGRIEVRAGDLQGVR